MNEITISGDELIFDGSQILKGYFSIGVGQGLEISDNIISIDNQLMNDINKPTSGFCVAYSAGQIPDLSDGDIVPFNKASGLSDISNAESAKLFSYPEFEIDLSYGFDASNSEYIVPVSGNYMLGWNAFVDYSESTNIVYDFENVGGSPSLSIGDALILYKQFLHDNDWNYDLDSLYGTSNASAEVSVFNGGDVASYNGKYYRAVYNNADDPSNGYIEKVLPNYPGTLIVRYANPHGGNAKLKLNGNTKLNIGPNVNTPQEFTISFTGGETFRYEEQIDSIILLLSLTITGPYSEPEPFPVIRLEKNGYTLIKGGKDNAQNETRHIVNHLEEGDKLRLTVSGYFRLRGLNSTTFYGYLLDKDDSAEIVKSTTNLNVNALTTTGDTSVGGDLIVKGKILDGSGASTITQYTLTSTQYAFQVTSNLNAQEGYITNEILHFNYMPTTTNVDYFCVPDASDYDLTNKKYVVPVAGKYQFGVRVFNQESGSGQSTGQLSIYKNSDLIITSGAYDVTAEHITCLVDCAVDDKIYVKCALSTLYLDMSIGHCLFYGYLLNPIIQLQQLPI